MGKGQSQKRRLANAVKANQGNLHKAQFRKATKSLPLPAAPSADDFKEKIPASLRKLQLLKAVAEGTAPRPLKTQPSRGKPKRRKQQPVAEPATAAPASSVAAGEGDAQEPQPKRKSGQDAPMPYQEPEKASANKKRKKEYMRQKDARKKRKVSDADLPVEKEQELTAKERTGAAKFGEQAHAPPTVNLKRKHWDPQAAQQASSDRLKRVFTKQMEDAQRRNASTAYHEGGGGGGEKQQAFAEGEREALRLKVIAAYREQRQIGQKKNSSASAETLAKLVQRGKEPR